MVTEILKFFGNSTQPFHTPRLNAQPSFM